MAQTYNNSYYLSQVGEIQIANLGQCPALGILVGMIERQCMLDAESRRLIVLEVERRGGECLMAGPWGVQSS